MMSTSSGFPISDLGTDLLLAIFKFLDPKALASLSCTCRKIRDSADNPELWRTLAYERWGDVNASAFPSTPTSKQRDATSISSISANADGAPATATACPPALPGDHLAADGRPGPQTTTSTANTVYRRSYRHSQPASAVAWKTLFAAGNGWEPPRLHHTVLQPAGDYISAMQPLRLPPTLRRGTGRGSPGDGGPTDLLLALADSEQLQVWRMGGGCPAPTASGAGAGSSRGAAVGGSTVGSNGGRGGSGVGDEAGGGAGGGGWAGPTGVVLLQPTAAHPLARHALIYSLAWINSSSSNSWDNGREGGSRSRGAGVVGGSSRDVVSGNDCGSAAGWRGGFGVAGGLMLAAGTYQGTVEWYAYDEDEDEDAAGGGGPGGSTGNNAQGGASGGRLRLLHTSQCGAQQPLVDLHVLPASGSNIDAGGGGSGSGAGPGFGVGLAAGSGGGLLAALQDASFALAGPAGIRNAVQLFDVATQRHVAAIVEPFESHEFVCCCPVAGSGRSGAGGAVRIDPHVLLVGSVHGSFCTQCFKSGLPSLCHHKHRSATAALSTLDVRCPRSGLTQRFGLHHRSLYPRLATAREHFVFTSHAGTALEVHDRRAMSAPLYTLTRLPRLTGGPPHSGRGGAAGATAATGSAAAAFGSHGGSHGRATQPTGSSRYPACRLGWTEGCGAPSALPSTSSRWGEGAEEEEGEVEEERDQEDEGKEELDDQDQEEEEQEEEEEGDSVLAAGFPPMAALPHQAVEGWRDGPAAMPYEHQGLWLEASDDVLVGRADNGTLWLWDLSTSLGWARGPERSGLWHWLDEHGPLPPSPAAYDRCDAYDAYEHNGTNGDDACIHGGGGDALGGVVGEPWGEASFAAAGGRSGGWEGAGAAVGRSVWSAAAGCQAVCLGSVACSGTMPVCALTVGDPTALFSLGICEDGGREYVVKSVVAPRRGAGEGRVHATVL